MRTLVTGAKGMLGSDLCPALTRHGYELTATDIEEMDVRDSQRVRKVFAESAPDIVFHLAALTDVDYCEQEPEQAYRTNTIGTQNVALACQAANIPLVYISTISVFDGTKCEAYTEFDQPNPANCYARAKYQGECIVQSLLSHYYVIRAGWMFGGGPEDKKFVAKIMQLARGRSELMVVSDKYGSPTYTRDFAQATIQLSESGMYGVYHSVNVGQPCSRHEFAEHILEYAGLESCKVIPVTSARFPLPAPRPCMEGARNFHAELLGLRLMRPWPEALKAYVQELLKSA